MLHQQATGLGGGQSGLGEGTPCAQLFGRRMQAAGLGCRPGSEKRRGARQASAQEDMWAALRQSVAEISAAGSLRKLELKGFMRTLCLSYLRTLLSNLIVTGHWFHSAPALLARVGVFELELARRWFHGTFV